ncbi:MAG: transglycosylase family protein, partial [Actinomycetota bacterium]|nr:transglycosylase family protein [Actinomycetota bacterium]
RIQARAIRRTKIEARPRARPRQQRSLLEDISGLNHLHFSARAHKRARRRRVRAHFGLACWLLMTAGAAAFGFKAPIDGLELIRDLERAFLDVPEGRRPIGVSGAGARITRAEPRFSPGPRRPRPGARAGPTPKPAVDPTPSPTPLPTLIQSVSSEDAWIADIVYEAAAEFGIDGDYLLSVARCESALHQYAYNVGGYHGLFQFDFQTWGAYGYGDIYDPVAQARTAARLIADGQTQRWPNCA